MQELLADLLPYLFGFYLLDAAANVRRHHLLLVAELGRYQLRQAGLTLAGLLPGSEVLSLQAAPLLFSEQALWRQDPKSPYSPVLPAPAELARLGFAELGTLTVEGKKLLRDDQLFLQLPSKHYCDEVGSLLLKLRDAGEGKRLASYAEATAAAGDLEAVRRRRRATLTYGPYLRPLAWAYALCLFGLLPVTVFAAESTPLILERVLMVVGGLLVAILAVSGLLLHHSGLKPGAVASQLAVLLFLPFAAAHPLLHLTRELYARFHWSAVAAAVLDKADFAALARQELHRIDLSRPRGSAEGLDAFWDSERRRWEKLVGQAGLSLEEVLSPPAASSPGAERFCPLCSAQFRAAADSCQECGAGLLPLASPPSAAPRQRASA